jgi:DNA-binding NarL/FixJ family response regulator
VAGIFLIDAHVEVRDGLKQLLTQASHTVCGEAERGEQALALLDDVHPDLVLIDLAFGLTEDLHLIRQLRQREYATLVYAFYEDANTIEKTFAAGASGYVTKREMSATILDAVRQVLAGRRHLSPLAAQSLAIRLLATRERQQGAP